MSLEFLVDILCTIVHSSLSPSLNGLYTPFVLLPFGQWVFDKSPPFPGDRNLQREGVVNRQIPPANISPLMRGVRWGLKSLPSGGELEGSYSFPPLRGVGGVFG